LVNSGFPVEFGANILALLVNSGFPVEFGVNILALLPDRTPSPFSGGV
jgi:hypothetical protein